MPKPGRANIIAFIFRKHEVFRHKDMVSKSPGEQLKDLFFLTDNKLSISTYFNKWIYISLIET